MLARWAWAKALRLQCTSERTTTVDFFRYRQNCLAQARVPVLLCHSFFAWRVDVHWNQHSLSRLVCVPLCVLWSFAPAS